MMMCSLGPLNEASRLVLRSPTARLRVCNALRYYSQSTPAPLLVTPQEIRKSLQSGGNAIALDASWYMPNSPRKPKEEFQLKRLPKSSFFDLDEVASAHELGLKHMLPSGRQFAQALEKYGVRPSTHVVLYDSHGVFSSPRALYTFRAFGYTNSSVLDGGLPRWEAEGLRIPKFPPVGPRTTPSVPEASLDTAVVRSYEQIVSNSFRDPSSDPTAELVVDARELGRFLGKDPEPRPELPSGHIPHSFSLPFNTFLQTHTSPSGATYTTFKPVPELRNAIISAIGHENARRVLSGEQRIVTTCGSGMTAGVLWLGLKLLGVENIGLYDESWTGYAARPGSKIETSE